MNRNDRVRLCYRYSTRISLPFPADRILDGQFFDCVTYISDDSNSEAIGDWDVNGNDIPGGIARGTRHLKRAFDSMAMGTLYTHEWRIHPNTAVPRL